MIKGVIKDIVSTVKSQLPRYIIMTAWILANLIAFLVVFFQYETAMEYFYLRKLVKHGLSFSRASAFCINMNCAFLLLPVCRNFISYSRSILSKKLPTHIVRVLDKHISFHRQIGYTIIVFSTHDTKISPNNNSSNQDNEDSGLISTLSNLQTDSPLNPAKSSIPVFEAFKLLPGITGILMCLILSLIASSSSAFFRRSVFNVFWYMHQILALLFLIFFVVHGLQGVVKKQVNLDRNDPQKCYQRYLFWSPLDRECDIPKFAGSSATSWSWVIFSLIIYFLERVARFLRSLRQHEIAEYKQHASKVLELVVNNSGTNKIIYRPGQYIYLNVKDISFFEWHPFTITSSPDDSNLTVHIRCEGDWTKSLQEKISTDSLGKPGIEKISIDGPYGTCAEDIFKYSSVVLVGAGIGVTPYSSILKHIWYMASRDTDIKLKKIYFFWICPSIDTFEWFGHLLYDLEQKMKRKADMTLLEYRIYLTRGWSLKEAKQIAINHGDEKDLFTGLEQKTHYGRPNFEVFFQDVEKKNREKDVKEDVGVFFCGPDGLNRDLHRLCNKHSSENANFVYNKESF